MPTDNRTRAASQHSKHETHAPFDIRMAEGVLAAQYSTGSGPLGFWNAQVNRAADTQTSMAGRTAIECTSMLDEGAQVKLGGAEDSIAKVRAPGLQAAEWHRMAQSIGQVSHDITQRIEEMGQYHF